MVQENDLQEIQKRLRMLEEENAKLRELAKPGGRNQLRVIEGEYKGHPTLSFEGPCRPFTLGLTKLRLVREAWPQIEEFLNRHNTQNSKGLPSAESEEKI